MIVIDEKMDYNENIDDLCKAVIDGEFRKGSEYQFEG